MKNKLKEKIMTLVYKYEAYKLSMSDLIDSIDKLYMLDKQINKTKELYPCNIEGANTDGYVECFCPKCIKKQKGIK